MAWLGRRGGQGQTVFSTQTLEVIWRARDLAPEGFRETLGFPRPCKRGGGSGLAGPGWPGFHLWTVLSYFFGRGQGNPCLSAASLCGGMSGMFGIWVFTSQGAHGSLVLKCGFSVLEGGGVLWAWLVTLSPELHLDPARLFPQQVSLSFPCQGGRLTVPLE